MRLNYLEPLDGVRACALLLVFVAHAGMERVVPGGLGVTIFFFLSGYLITSLLRAEWTNTSTISLRGFYMRRALRILPPLYVTLLLFSLVDMLPGSTQDSSAMGLTSILFYFYNYAHWLHINPNAVPSGLAVAWSLMVEEHFYLLFPLLFLTLHRRRWSTRSITTLLLTLCVAALAWRIVLVRVLHISLATPTPWTYLATDARFDAILWGCVLALAANPWCGDEHPWLARRSGALALGGLLLLLLTLAPRSEVYRQTLRYTLQSLALLPIFYHVAAAPQSRWVRWLSWSPLRWLGGVSYALYLLHLGVLLKLRTYTHLPPLLVGVAGFVIACMLAELVRRCVEQPIRALRHHRPPATSQPPAVLLTPR